MPTSNFNTVVVPVNECLYQQVFNQVNLNTCLLLYPSRAALRLARLKQQQLAMPFLPGLTMQDFCAKALPANAPLLKAEQRSLALFSSMQPVQRQYFGINSYFDLPQFASRFFKLFTELAAEGITDETIYNQLSPENSGYQWQQEHFTQLCQVRDSYQDFLQQQGYSDQIFWLDVAKLQGSEATDLLKDLDVASIAVVNQFRLTGLERALLSQVAPVTLFYHGVNPTDVNPQQLAALAVNGLNEQLDIIVSPDTTTSLSQFATKHQQAPYQAMVDFAQSELLQQVDANYITAPAKPTLAQTPLYGYFFAWQQLVSSYNYKNPGLLPLQAVFEAATNNAFMYAHNAPQPELVAWLTKLARQGYLYVPLGEFPKGYPAMPDAVTPVWQQIVEQLKLILALNSFADFYKQLKAFDYITCLQDFYYKHEAADAWQEVMADFKALQAWLPFSDGISLLRMLCSMLKPRPIKTRVLPKPDAAELTTLQDTRNLGYSHIALLHVQQEYLPGKPHPPWLLSENQRAKLGLITWNQAQLRDTYYLFRLIAQSQQVTIFANEDANTDTRPSLLLNLLQSQKPGLEFTRVEQSALSAAWQHFLADTTPLAPPELPADFFALPLDKTRALKLNAHSWKSLKNDPFTCWWQYQARLEEFPYPLVYDFTPALAGNLAHQLLALTWSEIVSDLTPRFNYGLRLYNHTGYHRRALLKLLRNPLTKLKMPQNHAKVYFNRMYLPRLRYGAKTLFYILDKHLQGNPIIVKHEHEDAYGTDAGYKPLPFALPMPVLFGARADLRLQEQNGRGWIIDYKTGKAKPEKERGYLDQLLLYLLYYHGGPVKAGELADTWQLGPAEAALYWVEDKTFKTMRLISKKDIEVLFADLHQQLTTAVNGLLSQGWSYNGKTPPDWYQNLVRPQLYTGQVANYGDDDE